MLVTAAKYYTLHMKQYAIEKWIIWNTNLGVLYIFSDLLAGKCFPCFQQSINIELGIFPAIRLRTILSMYELI